MEIKRYILFSIGIIGLILSGVWFLKNPDFEPIVCLIASLGTLISDFLFVDSTKRFSEQDLQERRYDSLKKDC